MFLTQNILHPCEQVIEFINDKDIKEYTIKIVNKETLMPKFKLEIYFSKWEDLKLLSKNKSAINTIKKSNKNILLIEVK